MRLRAWRARTREKKTPLLALVSEGVPVRVREGEQSAENEKKKKE